MHCVQCREEMSMMFVGYLGRRGTIVGCTRCGAVYRQINEIRLDVRDGGDREAKFAKSQLTYDDWMQILRVGQSRT